MRHALGRLPRGFDPRVPHLSALTAGQTLPPAPVAVDWAAKLPLNLGMMLNDQLGDCTCAAFYHALQVWSANANPPMVTEPDSCVEALYSTVGGYKPGDSSTDNGADEQTVLTDLVNVGAPMADGGFHKLAAFVEVDPRNVDDVKRTIADCGVAYIGFEVPAFLENLEDAGSTWDVDPKADNSSQGGHAVILVGYDAKGLKVISWGGFYTMTWAFFGQFVDEVYALADPDWIAATGGSPGGLTLAELETAMSALKAPDSPATPPTPIPPTPTPSGCGAARAMRAVWRSDALRKFGAGALVVLRSFNAATAALFGKW